jgi:hypothetical protein
MFHVKHFAPIEPATRHGSQPEVCESQEMRLRLRERPRSGFEKVERAKREKAFNTQAGLPVLPHQEETLRLAANGLEQIKPGLSQDAFVVMTRDPQLARDVAVGQEIQVLEFCSRVEARQQAREALTARGRGVIEAWAKLERDYEAAGKARNWDAERAIGTDMMAFAKTLKQDAALDTLLREHERELGVAEGSRLDNVVRPQEIGRALTRAINIEHGPKPNYSPSPGM